ncbi:MAG: M6 family metalloprotease domain-containing protein [Phycisphaerae bacterium]
MQLAERHQQSDTLVPKAIVALQLRSFAWMVAFILTLSFVATAKRTTACPASPLPIEVTQPDGTKLSLTFVGDKYYHWYEDRDGYVIVRDGQKYAYASLSESGDLVPTEHLARRKAPASLRLTRGLRPSANAVSARRSKIHAVPATAQGNPIAIEPQGVVKNLVVLCKFADHSFGVHTRPEADYNFLFNGLSSDPVLAPTGTVRMAFDENSYGTLDLQSTVAAWVTLPHPESYYTGGSSGLQESYPTNPQGMVEDALDAVDALIDFGDFDQDNDGYIDAISIVHSGYGAETGGGNGFWMWSHRWSLWALPGGEWSSNDNNALGNPVRVYDYHTEPALWGTNGTDISRIGVIVHETGHFFGLPDYYDTNGGGSGIGSYCMMANSWGFDGSQLYPPHFSAYSKMQLGWMTPTSISTSGSYTLNQAETSPEAYRVDLNYPAGEYLLIENRQPVGLESIMPQGGLCIWHIDEAKCCNTDEGYPGQSGWPGNNQHYRVALLQADGDFDLEKGNNRGDDGDVYHGAGVDEINSTTTPNTNAYQGGNIVVTDHNIYNISVAGPQMSFNFASFIDCNNNGTEDATDIASGTSNDCSGNGIPDECELGTNDCNGNNIPDDCDIINNVGTDCDNNGVIDSCEVAVSGILLDSDFESGLDAGWNANGIFQITGSCSATSCGGGSQWAYAGSTGSCTYGDNQSGQITAPTVTLGYGQSLLSFCTRYETESDYDFARVFANNELVWEASGSAPAWDEVSVDLSSFAGQSVDIRFDFFSDAFVSGFLGWQIDDVWLETGAPDCNTNNLPDACDISSGTSNDNNGDGIPDECTGCINDSECDDGLFCNGAETCVAGACIAGTAPDCNDNVDCTTDTCNENTDSCDNTVDNAACDDGLFCNGVETCDAVNGCQAGTPIDCNDDVDCTTDACNEDTDSCDNTVDNAACDDGLFCNGVETCDAVNGCQAGTPIDCNDDVDCTTDTCNEDTDSCDNTVDNASCDDGLFCNGVETCDAVNGCQAGTPIDCNDDVDCTTDTCNEDTDSCDNTVDNAACDDGLFCNGVETCDAVNGCQAGTPVDCNDDVDCTFDGCNELTDSCENTPANVLCDDGLFCNGTEVCDAVQGCVAGTPITCNDGIDCTVDTCNETFDLCQSDPDDSLCQNGLYCDGVETCNAKNGCEAGTNPCPVDLECDEANDTCVGCMLDSQCDDANECTDDICQGMECVFIPNYDDFVFCCDPLTGALQGLSDGDPCTIDSCDLETGVVEHIPGSPFICAIANGGRFLDVELLTKPGQSVAIRLTHSDIDAGPECVIRYVQPDGTLADNATFLPSEQWGSVLVYGIEIVPDRTYELQVDDGFALLGDPLPVTTAPFGDVDGNSVVNFSDIQQTVLVFQQLAPYSPAADLKPCVPNFIVNFEDILSAVQGFQNFTYVETECPAPCN